MPRTIVIAGGAGFIGIAFTHLALEHYPEDRIVVFDKLTYASDIRALDDIRSSRYSFIKGDISSPGDVEGLFRREHPDIIVNLAAESHVDRSIEDPALFIRTNTEGPAVLMAAAVRHGLRRFHQVSTDEVYGDLPIEGDGSFSEDSPLRPSSPYSASKAAADQLALAFMRTYGLEVTVSRCCNCFGPHQHQEKFIPTIIASALSGHPVPIYGSGLNVREWITSADHARAILAILDRGRPGEIYNTGSGVRLSNIELAGMLLSILGRDRSLIRHTEDRKGHDRRYSISSEKIRQELGFVPQDSFILSLEKTVAWYAARGLPSSSPDVL